MNAITHSASNEHLNKEKLQRYQDITTLALGVGCGILCLETTFGFLFYTVGTLMANSVFYILCCEGHPHKFFTSPIKQIFFDAIFNNLPGFVMMWCFTFALVQ